MAVRIAVVEHESTCPPAHVGTWLAEAGATLDVVRPWAGDAVPEPGSFDGLVVLGGSMGAKDDDLHHWLGPLKQLVRDCVADGTPVLGICLGHQLVGAALGGTIEVNPRGQQVGVLETRWLDEAADDPLFGPQAGLATVGIQWNDDLVTVLPPGAVALARTAQGELQVARFADRVWGVQLHPEIDEHIVLSWAADDREDHVARGLDQEALLAEIAQARAELDSAWRPVTHRFVALVDGA